MFCGLLRGVVCILAFLQEEKFVAYRIATERQEQGGRWKERGVILLS